ncbi:GT-D fold domain-containing glycosyltransferase [Paenibacillus macerans]|uniref:GT-D fold domain-containing protein n=1 Tax=Paenibacillus macerans TaxID=44252 RepID=UPI003D317E8D
MARYGHKSGTSRRSRRKPGAFGAASGAGRPAGRRPRKAVLRMKGGGAASKRMKRRLRPPAVPRRRKGGRGAATATNPPGFAPPPPPQPLPASDQAAPANVFMPDAAEIPAAVWDAAAVEGVRAAAYEEGRREGMFDGGEAKLGRLIPRHMLLPELTVDDVIAAGFRSVSGLLHPLLTPEAVYAAAAEALREGRPMSIVRLGDGELLTLAHGTVLPAEEAMRWGAFLPYAGVQLPDAGAREALADAVCAADIVGVPESRHPSYQGLLFPVLRHFGIDYRGLRLTTSTVNYELNDGGYLARLLKGRRLLLIGNQAQELAEFFMQRGMPVAGWLAPVQGVADVPAILERAREYRDFDLALVSAGVGAVMICARLARELGKVTLDLGHLANKLILGEAVLPLVGEV